MSHWVSNAALAGAAALPDLGGDLLMLPKFWSSSSLLPSCLPKIGVVVDLVEKNSNFAAAQATPHWKPSETRGTYYSPSRPSPAGLEAPTLYLHLYVLQLLRQLKSLKKKFRAASYRFSSFFTLCKLLSPFFLRLKVHFVQDGYVYVEYKFRQIWEGSRDADFPELPYRSAKISCKK